MIRAVRAGCFLLGLAAAIPAQQFEVVKVMGLGKGYTFTEGPAWSKDGYLIFSDLAEDTLFKWKPGAEIEVFRSDAHGPSGNAFDSQGRLYTCETRTRRVTRTDKNGKIEVLAEQFEGKRLNAPDHVAVSKSDHVYFTDPAFGGQSDHRELDFYGVYRIPSKGVVKLVAKATGRPNGIALSPNGRTLYVTNSDDHNVRAYDIDRDGDAANERVLIPGIKAAPMGITTDDKGNLYVAAGGVAIYTPEGRRIQVIELHEPASACAFGETDLRTLFITARGNVYRVRLGEE